METLKKAYTYFKTVKNFGVCLYCNSLVKSQTYESASINPNIVTCMSIFFFSGFVELKLEKIGSQYGVSGSWCPVVWLIKQDWRMTVRLFLLIANLIE